MDRIKVYYKYVICIYKLFVAYVYVLLKKEHLYNKNIWLIQEKHTEARDNGYYLFKYLKSYHPDLNVFFSITTNSSDRNKVEMYGNVIDADTILHYIFYLSAKYSISSQPNGACPYPAYWVHRFKFLCRKDQKIVFLQHGVTKDAIDSFRYSNTNYDLFICAAAPEHRFVCEYLGYPRKNAKLLGFCRFDYLHGHNSEKQIIVMPTFRTWLTAFDRESDATDSECDAFKQSVFYIYYSALLSDKRLLKVLSEYKYKLVFYLHYSLQSYTKIFNCFSNQNVIIASRNDYDVQELLIRSKLLITDYSSVAFDFAYMEKPVIYFQFDEHDYRTKHYKKGYFDYPKDGFGPVFDSVEDVVNNIVQQIENNCVMDLAYKEKVKDFFPLRDTNNCLRHYEVIKDL